MNKKNFPVQIIAISSKILLQITELENLWDINYGT